MGGCCIARVGFCRVGVRYREMAGKDRYRPRCGERRKLANRDYYRGIGLHCSPNHPETRRSSRFRPIELTTFKVAGILKAVKKETDQDYHLVIADPANPDVTMIVEAPDPRCALGSKFLDNIDFVRHEIDRQFGFGVAEIRRLEPNVPVTVTGVAFFDALHGQEGVAPNGIELHPILVIAFQ